MVQMGEDLEEDVVVERKQVHPVAVREIDMTLPAKYSQLIAIFLPNQLRCLRYKGARLHACTGLREMLTYYKDRYNVGVA